MIVVPFPPDPAEPFEELHRRDRTLERLETLRDDASPFVRAYLDQTIPSVEALTEGMAAMAATLQQPPPEDVHQMWTRPHGATDWEPLGYTTGPVIGLDHGAADPYESAVLAWPHQYGKTAFAFELTVPFTSSMRGLFDALDASYQAALDRRLVRLADDLGRFLPHVRHDFHAVQQVLETAGVLDGYGRITIPQPIRPSIPWRQT